MFVTQPERYLDLFEYLEFSSISRFLFIIMKYPYLLSFTSIFIHNIHCLNIHFSDFILHAIAVVIFFANYVTVVG